jgi:hypothetical protein
VPFDYDAHRRSMVERFLFLRRFDKAYASARLLEYEKHPDCHCKGIRKDVEAALLLAKEKAVKPP